MLLASRALGQRPIHFAQTLSAGIIQFDPEIEQHSPLVGSGVASMHPLTEEITVKGNVQVSLKMECDRCAEPFTQEINEEFDLIYVPTPESDPGAEVAIGAEDSKVGFYDPPGLELNDILQEQVLLAMPLQRVCRADCQGICPNCGVNRNETDCDCKTQIIDERWSALKNL